MALSAKEEGTLEILTAESDEEMGLSQKQSQLSGRRVMLGFSAALLMSLVVVGAWLQSTPPGTKAGAEVENSPVDDAIQMPSVQTAACNKVLNGVEDSVNKKLGAATPLDYDIDQTIFDNNIGPTIPLGICRAQYNVKLVAETMSVGDTMIDTLQCLAVSGMVNKDVNLSAAVTTSPGISGKGQRMAKCSFATTAKVKFEYDIGFEGLEVSTKIDAQTKGASLKYAQVYDFKVSWSKAIVNCKTSAKRSLDLCAKVQGVLNSFPAKATLTHMISGALGDAINYELAEKVDDP